LFKTNTIYSGDCLFVLKHDFPPNSVDLIYLDPPFFTGKIQKGEWSPGAMEVSFEDSREFWRSKRYEHAPDWMKHIGVKRPDFASYLYYMQQRLEACKRVLKNTGSIWLHCDYRASHYLKMVMDEVFSENNFRNEIAWIYTRPGTKHQKQFPATHETLFWYSQGEPWTFNVDDIRIPYAKGTFERGRYSVATSKVTKGIEKRVLPKKGKCPETWWHIPLIQGNARERLGYPTQKPETLLERIVKVSSNSMDVVLDPFCGCGTAVVVAHRLGRRWVGIDISPKACFVMKERFRTQLGFDPPVISRNLDEVMKLKENEFEAWVNDYYNATKPSPDLGVDGITKEGIPIQTKALATPVSYDIIDAFLTATKYHPEVPKPVSKMVVVSQSGFDEKARARVFKVEKTENIKIELIEPKDLIKED